MGDPVTEIEDRTAHDLIVRATDVGVCPIQLIPRVLHEWREPRHEAFAPRNAWSLFNAFTEALKGNLIELPRRTEALHGLLEVLGGIGELYAIEKQAREEQLTHDRRQHLRHKKSLPRLAALKQKVIALRQGALPNGLIARACDYALGIWDRLEVYLEDGQIQIDNNAAERSIRPVALGRKNWLHFGSKEAGPRIAAILSVMETCRRCAVPVREYLLDVLPRLASGKATDVTSLTPQAWAASRTQAAAQAQAH